MDDRQSEANSRYLVTGVSGLLGLNLASYWISKGREIYGLAWRNEVKREGLHCVCCDLRDSGRIRALLLKVRPAVVIHCAAATNVEWCEKNPADTFAINALPCSEMVSAVNEIGGTFVLISTDSVFDGANGQYRENDEPRPLNVYAKSKLAGEEIVSKNAERWIILRTNIYGWNGQQKNSLAEWILQELTTKRMITGFDDVIFSPLLASDLGPLIEKIIAKQLQGLYHAGAANAVSKYGFARQLAELYGLNTETIRRGKLADAKLTAPRPLNTSLISAKLQNDLAEPMPSIEDGLHRFYEQGMNGWAQRLKTAIL
jgi:dTDP-4-dehydrorhamnose reductase